MVAASVTFLDGNATAASQMQSRLSSDSPEVVQGIFPESTFGPVIMSAVNQTNVTNPGKSPRYFFHATQQGCWAVLPASLEADIYKTRGRPLLKLLLLLHNCFECARCCP